MGRRLLHKNYRVSGFSGWIRKGALAGFVLIQAGTSWLLWTLPVQIAAEGFWKQFIVLGSGHPAAFALFAWFLWGAYKTAAAMYLDPSEAWGTSSLYRLNTFLFVPLAPLRDLKLPRDPFRFKAHSGHQVKSKKG